MIEVKNLVKIYGNDTNSTKALNNVSFKLPDKGLIFIVGKSGSGKSTLLNMIGSLDDITSGNIIIDNKDITKFNSKELDYYRNQYLGIIYQNYNLFENETILDNIKIAVTLNPTNESNEEVNNRIYKLLDDVDLKEQKDKIVKNMSGGQKQRVAIARALIKNPQLILADEPTGNLDSKTTNIIFNLLKKISKDRLVVVISHDSKSAFKYGDRIIEISDGTIYSDKIRNNKIIEEKSKETDHTYIYSDKKLNSKQLDLINDKLIDTQFRIKNNEEEFINTKDEDIVFDSKTMNLKKNNANFKTSFKTFLIFLKSSINSFIGTILLSIFIIAILALSLSFSLFDGKRAMNDIKTKFNESLLTINKGYSYTNNSNNIEKSSLIRINDNDISKLEEVYDKDYYLLYSIPCLCGDYNIEIGQTVGESNFNGCYIRSGLGVSVIDNKYLNSIYPNYQIVAGSMYNIENSSGLIISDYYADCLLNAYPSLKSNDLNDSYQNLLDKSTFDQYIGGRYQIGAIIKTDYKTKYKDIIEGYELASNNQDRAKEIIKEITSSDLFTTFHDEVYSKLAILYTLNPKYIENYPQSTYFGNFRNGYIYYNNDFNNPFMTMSASNNYVCYEQLEDDEIYLNSSDYARLIELYKANNTNTSNSTDSTTKLEIEVMLYDYDIYDTTADTPLNSFTLKVVGSVNTVIANYVGVSRNTFNKLYKDCLYPYSIIIEDGEYAVEIQKALTDSYFYSDTYVYGSLYTLMSIITVFNDIFMILSVFLIIILLIVVLGHNFRIIKHERYRIGIYKALGCSNISLYSAIFIYSIITVAVIYSISLGFTALLSSFADALLRFSFCKFMGNNIYNEISLLYYNFIYTSIFNVVILIATLLSSYIPFALIKNIKPNEILRKADD